MKQIEFLTPSLIELVQWILDNDKEGYKLMEDCPQMIGWQYYAVMNQVEQEAPVEDKPARKTKVTKES